MDIREQFIDIVHSAKALAEEAQRLADIVETEAPGTMPHILADLSAMGLQPPPWLFNGIWTPYAALISQGRNRFYAAQGSVMIIPLWGRRLRVLSGLVKVEVFDGREWYPWGLEAPEGFLSARITATGNSNIELDIF